MTDLSEVRWDLWVWGFGWRPELFLVVPSGKDPGT